MHMFKNKEDFVSLKPVVMDISTAGKGQPIKALGKGDVKIMTRDIHGRVMQVILNDALWVPACSENLVSDMKLLRQGIKVTLDDDDLTRSMVLQQSNGAPRVIPLHVDNDLYKIAYHPPSRDRARAVALFFAHMRKKATCWKPRLAHRSAAVHRGRGPSRWHSGLPQSMNRL